MSLLPTRILPQSAPLGRMNEDGMVRIEKDWWLLLYNLCLQSLSTGTALPADALLDLEGADTDAIDADAIVLRRPLDNLGVQVLPDTVISPSELPDLARALLLAQDAQLPDPIPQAQPGQAVAVGASPFTYTAPFNGHVLVTGGTVSAISLIRQSATFATGLTSGFIPVSRLDQVKVTYSSTPTMNFLSI